MTATLTRWYEEHGRHEIFAGGKNVPLASGAHASGADASEAHASEAHASEAHSLSLNQEAVQSCAQTDLDELGVPKNSREEKIMARLYRQRMLGEKPLVQIQSRHKSSEGN